METMAQQLLRASRLIEALEALVERHVGERAPERAADALRTLAERLLARIRLEEERLFPAIEALVGVPDFAPTARMRREHAVLLELLAGITAGLLDGNFAAADGDLREFRAALRAHTEEERNVLLPIVGLEERGDA